MITSVRRTHQTFPLLEPERANTVERRVGASKPPRVPPDLARAKVDVDRVGRSLDDLLNMGARIFRGCLRLDDICRETEQRSAKVFGLLDAIERRIGPLDEVRELTRALDTRLASARQIAEEFAGRVSESQAAFVDITARMSEVDAKRESIDLALSAATHVALTLDQRIAAFTGPEHVLRQAETAYEELELRSRETVADLSARVAGLSAERQAIESALAQAAQQARVLAERLSLLTGPDQALSGAEQRLEEIERRAGHAFADLGARAADLDARCGAIDAVLTAAARGADAVDRRAATLAAPDQPLGQAELRCENLEQRGAQALADFATRASELDAGRQAIELALGKAKQQIQELEDRLASFTVPDEALRQAEARIEEVERRTVHAVTVMATRVTEIAGERHAIEAALAEAERLQTCIAGLMAPDSVLRKTQAQLEDLKDGAAVSLGDLERRASDLTDQSCTIEAFLAQAEHARKMFSDVEARLAALTNEGELRRVETAVADLEGRASDVAGQLQRVITRTDGLEDLLVNAHRQLEVMGETARADFEKLATASKRAGRAADGSLTFWRILTVSAVAVLLALGIFVIGARTGPTSPLETSQPLLTSTSRSLTAIAMTMELPRPMAPNIPSGRPLAATGPAASPSQPAEAVKEVAQPSQGRPVAATPVTREPPASSSGRVGSTPPAATTTEDATVATVQFMGGLEVISEPSGAAVYLDGIRAGETPLSLGKIRAGSHALWVVHDGFARWTRGIQVVANSRIRVNATLEPIP